ncbi:sulfite exporter TauE/SafE family protein [Pseudoxanthomonas putridarboris]|uniref:Probable membrane transporter protein n=1 Tax=Pseudoxanthomonas putridarboris TaxID=752605 RepID=A0ABU9J0T0_9GAMM
MWIIVSTFLIAGLVKGATGMGLPTIAMGLLGALMPPVAAATMLVVPSFVTNAWQLASGPAAVGLVRRLWPMMLGIVMGTVAGSALLVRMDPLWTGLALGVALMGHAGYALASPSASVPRRSEPWLSPVVGLVTGAISGATGVFVMPAVPYLQSLRLDKDELVQALGLSFTVSTVALATGLWGHGAFRPGQLGLSALAVVPALAGMWVGQRIRARISQVVFRRCFLLLLFVLGSELALRPLF